MNFNPTRTNNKCVFWFSLLFLYIYIYYLTYLFMCSFFFLKELFSLSTKVFLPTSNKALKCQHKNTFNKTEINVKLVRNRTIK